LAELEALGFPTKKGEVDHLCIPSVPYMLDETDENNEKSKMGFTIKMYCDSSKIV